MLFLHSRKEESDLQGSFDTYKEHFKSRENQIVPIQLKYEWNIDVLDAALEEIRNEQNEDNINEDDEEGNVVNIRGEYGFFILKDHMSIQKLTLDMTWVLPRVEYIIQRLVVQEVK